MRATDSARAADGHSTIWLVLAWLWVGVPLAWGVADTIRNAVNLFR